VSQNDWLEKDFYKTLGVSETSTEKDITKAYRKLARKYHPDANPNNSKAEDKFKEVSEAYEVLSEASTKKEYDEFRKYGPAVGFGGVNPGSSHGGQNFQGADFSDILGDILGGSRNSGAKGQDYETELTLSFSDAVAGITTSVNLLVEGVCKSCKGSGSKPGSNPELCKACQGKGSTDSSQGFFSFSQPCRHCSGRGMIVKDPCSDCLSTGSQKYPKQVKVKVPAGVKNGQRIRLKGKGGPGQNGAQSGNLYIRLKVGKHKMFGRSGKNLTLKLPLTFAEAALGANVKVPLLDGGSVTLKVPSNTSSGKIFRIKGKGVESKGAVGDLLVTISIDVPEEFDDTQIELLQQLADQLDSPRKEWETQK